MHIFPTARRGPISRRSMARQNSWRCMVLRFGKGEDNLTKKTRGLILIPGFANLAERDQGFADFASYA